MQRAIFLFPAWSVFGRQRLSPELAKAFGRADAVQGGGAGRTAQLSRHFAVLPKQWAPAALTRQVDAGDAAGAAWLRADPAHVRPDINGARLLGIGARLSLSQQDVDALLPALKPVFGDAGFALDAPTPARWYLRLAREARLPRFSDPDEALGEDLFEHQPDGPEGRRWRVLLSDVQIVLHNHPWNATRSERGLVAINALWVWGGGLLPDRVTSTVSQACSEDDLLRALMRVAGGEAQILPADLACARIDGDTLFDLRQGRDLAALQRDWLRPAADAVRSGALDSLTLDAADGNTLRLTKTQRWRFWRGAWSPPAAASSESEA